MPDMLSAVSIANEFRQELAALDSAAAQVMLDSWRGVEAALIDDMETFAARFAAGESLTPGQVLRMERYQALQAQVTAQLQAMERAAGPVVTAGQTQAAQLGALQAGTTLNALDVGLSFNTLSTTATQNVVALARAGRPLSALLEPMYGQAAEGIIRELINGVALGYGPRKVARLMAQDGLTDALNHLLLVTRDQYNRAHRTAAFQRYEDSGVVRGYIRRCARQAGRTCPACIALDGTFYELSVPFAEHPQGRCTMIPAIKGIEWKSRLGSGQAWFEALPEDAQIATMGRGRWEAWKAGELPWDKMAVKTNHPVWGPGVRVANVPDGYQRKTTGPRQKKVAAVPPPETVEWKPTMTPEEADIWAAQSEYKDPLYHLTNKKNVDAIQSGGFRVDSTNVAYGRTWGDGVYTFTNKDGDFASSYIKDAGDNGEVLELRANLKNPLVLDLETMKTRELRAHLATGDVHPLWNDTYKRNLELGATSGFENTVAKTAKDLGFDGLVIKGPEAQVVVFNPRRVTVVTRKRAAAVPVHSTSPFPSDSTERTTNSNDVFSQDDIALAWRDNLSDEQERLIKRWQSSNWSSIKDAYGTEETTDLARAFEQTLNTAPVTNGTLWRGINVGPGSQFDTVDDLLSHYRRAAGTTVEWSSPSSTTLRPRVATQFSNGVVFEIQPKTARGIGGHFLAESVTLPGTKYKVLRVSDVKVLLDGEERWVIQLIEE